MALVNTHIRDRTGQHSHVLVPHTDEEQMLEVRGLQETQLYEFWVTAATAAGEGEMSAIVAKKPSARGEILVVVSAYTWPRT